GGREWGRAAPSRLDPHSCGPVSAAEGLRLSRVRHLRRIDDLRPRHSQPIPARGRLRQPYPQGREAGRPAGAGADQVRAGDQFENRQGARPRSAGNAAWPRRRGDRVKRREFITLLGAAAAWPLAARARQGERMRHIGILLPGAADDPEYQARVGAFLQALGQLGWSIGRNVRIDTRWAAANAAEVRRDAAELVAVAPDVILAH